MIRFSELIKPYFAVMIIFVCAFSCTKKETFVEKEFYEEDIKIIGRFLNDTIRDGLFTSYYSNGSIAKIVYYEEGKLTGGTTDYYPDRKIAGYSVESKNSPHKVKWYPNGDTMLIVHNFISRSYYENKKPKGYARKDSTGRAYASFSFDKEGRIREYTGTQDYLTRQDSLRLDKAYPRWKEMIEEKELEKNQ